MELQNKEEFENKMQHLIDLANFLNRKFEEFAEENKILVGEIKNVST